MKNLMFALTLAVLGTAGAAPLTLTWNGGASGNLSDASWSGGTEGHLTPQAGDTLVLSTAGAFVNDLADELAGVTFDCAGAISLSGSQLKLKSGGSGLVTRGGCTVTFSAPILMGSGTAAIPLDVEWGSTNTFTACISGSSQINGCNYGCVNLLADNDYTGKTSLTKGEYHIRADRAFGTADGTTSVTWEGKTPTHPCKLYFYGGTFAEDFSVNAQGETGGCTFAANTLTTFDGKWLESNYDLYTYGAGAHVVFNGRATFPNPSGSLGGATLEFNGDSSAFGWDFWGGAGTIVYNCQSYISDSSHYVKISGTQTRKFVRDDAFLYKPAQPVKLMLNTASGIADLCGSKQTFWYVECPAGNANCVVTSAAPAVVHMTLGGDYWSGCNLDPVECHGTFRGDVSLCFDGPKPITIAGKKNTSVGYLALSNRADVTFAQGANWAGTNVVISGGAKLRLVSGNLPAETVVEIADDEDQGLKSKLHLDTPQEVAKLFVNGVELERGKYYGSSASGADVVDDDHFTGAGSFYVTAEEPLVVEATWTGAGADDNVTTPENWSCSPKLPALGGGQFKATVAGGARMTLDKTVWFKSLTFDRGATASNFEIVSVDGSVFRLSGDGVKTVGATGAVAHTNTITAPLELMQGTTALSAANTGDVLRIEGPLSSADDMSVTIENSGAGALYLTGTASMPISFTSKRGLVGLKGEALGTAGGSAVINQANGETEVLLLGGRFASPLTVQKYSANAVRGITLAPDTTNVFEGVYAASTSWGFTTYFGKGAVATFLGGLTPNYANHWHSGIEFKGSNEMTVANLPIMYPGTGMNRPWQVIARPGSAGNVFRISSVTNCYRTGITFQGDVRVLITVNNAFVTNLYPTPLMLATQGSGSPKIDLCGTTQTFGMLYKDGWDGTQTTDSCEITSEEPALLRAVQNDCPLLMASAGGGYLSSVTFLPRFTGAVGYEKLGTNAVVLASASSTTGALRVGDGTLSFSGSGAWTNCSEVAVTGGRLVVDSKSRLPKATAYVLTGGTLELAEGVSLKGTSLTLPDGQGGTVTHRIGEFSAENCPYIAGGGKIRLQTGALLIVK